MKLVCCGKFEALAVAWRLLVAFRRVKWTKSWVEMREKLVVFPQKLAFFPESAYIKLESRGTWLLKRLLSFLQKPGWRDSSAVKRTGSSSRFPAHTCWLTTVPNAGSRGFDTLFWLPWSLHGTGALTCMKGIHPYTYNKQYEKQILWIGTIGKIPWIHLRNQEQRCDYRGESTSNFESLLFRKEHSLLRMNFLEKCFPSISSPGTLMSL